MTNYTTMLKKIILKDGPHLMRSIWQQEVNTICTHVYIPEYILLVESRNVVSTQVSHMLLIVIMIIIKESWFVDLKRTYNMKFPAFNQTSIRLQTSLLLAPSMLSEPLQRLYLAAQSQPPCLSDQHTSKNCTVRPNQQRAILTHALEFLLHHADPPTVVTCGHASAATGHVLALLRQHVRGQSADAEGEFQTGREEGEVVRPCPLIVFSVVTGSSARPGPGGVSTHSEGRKMSPTSTSASCLPLTCSRSNCTPSIPASSFCSSASD